MEWKGKYKSEILMVCHQTAQDMYAAGAITDKEMREYDKDCLVSSSKTSYMTTSTPKQRPVSVFANSVSTPHQTKEK